LQVKFGSLHASNSESNTAQIRPEALDILGTQSIDVTPFVTEMLSQIERRKKSTPKS
jgi:hypothetical protein